MLSQNLHVHVTDEGQTKVKLTFGARAVDNLPDLIPSHLKPKLAARQIDLVALIGQAQSSNYAPGELFRLEEQRRTIRVWLE